MTATNLQTTHAAVKSDILSIRKELESTCGLIDCFYHDLGQILPDINLEIYKTNHKATTTLDSLRTDATNGKIDAAIAMISNEMSQITLKIEEIYHQDAIVLEAVYLLGNLLTRCANTIDKLPNSTTHAQLIDSFTDTVKALHTLHSELSEPIKKIVDMENTLLDSLKEHINDDIQTLNETLSTILFVLKDLVKRSDSAKPPILNIMTGLQVHDIVSQDLANIIRGLNESEIACENNTETLDFSQIILTQSSILLNSIIDILTNETEKISSETNFLTQIISNERDDKTLLSTYLLESEEQLSSFDAAISDFCHTLNNIQEKLELLAAQKWLIPGHLQALAENARNMEGLTIKIKNANLISDSDIESVILDLNKIYSLHTNLEGYSLTDLKQFIEHINEIIENVQQELSDIKSIMMESIDGVDSYCQRSLGYLEQFTNTINSSSTFIENLTGIISRIDNTCSNNFDQTCTQIEPKQIDFSIDSYQQIIERLTSPHISTINQTEEDADDDITFF